MPTQSLRMKRFLAATLLALAALHCSARAIPEDRPSDSSPSSFQLDEGETELVSQRFSSDPPGWQHVNTEMAGGELIALPDTRWAHATLRIDEQRSLEDGIWTFYWTCRTDMKKGEDASALHIKLWVTDDADREEQISINALLRATRGWYMLYVDPGYMVEHSKEMHLRPERNEFPDAQTLRSFRMRSIPDGPGQIAIAFESWDERLAAWTAYADYHTKQPALPLRVDIAKDLSGHATIKGLHFMYPSPAAAVAATALTLKLPR